MNALKWYDERIIHGFTRIDEEIASASLAQAPTRLLLRCGSAIETSLMGWFWSLVGVPCDPTLARAALHMSSLVEYQDSRSLTCEGL
jgi:hypothetical protein